MGSGLAEQSSSFTGNSEPDHETLFIVSWQVSVASRRSELAGFDGSQMALFLWKAANGWVLPPALAKPGRGTPGQAPQSCNCVV